MKRKAVLIIIIVLIIIVFLFIANYVRNYIIIKKIYDLEKMDLGNNFYFKNESSIPQMQYNCSEEYYYKDNILIIFREVENYSEEEKSLNKEFVVYNMNTEEYKEYIKNEDGIFEEMPDAQNMLEDGVSASFEMKLLWIEGIVNAGFYEETEFYDLIKDNMFNIVRKEENCIILKSSNSQFYINENTGVLEKIVSGETVLTNYFEKDIVTDTNIDINTYLSY